MPGLGRSPGEENGKPLQYSCLENPMDRGAWQATAHGGARVGHDLATKPPPSIISMIATVTTRDMCEVFVFYLCKAYSPVTGS